MLFVVMSNQGDVFSVLDNCTSSVAFATKEKEGLTPSYAAKNFLAGYPGVLFAFHRNRHGMLITGRDDAPLALGDRVGDGVGGRFVTIVIDARQRRLNGDLSKGIVHVLLTHFRGRMLFLN